MKISVTLFSILISSILFAQNPYSLHYTTQNSNLPSNNIRRLLADDLDNIWITTDSGLVRYYKDEWEIFNTSNSEIHSNNLDYFYIDNYNNLWFQVRRGFHHYIFQKFNGVNWIYTDTLNTCIEHRDIFSVDDSEGKWILQPAGIEITNLYYLFEDSCVFFTSNEVGINLCESRNILVDKNNRLWLTSSSTFPPYWGIVYYENSLWHSADYGPSEGFDVDYENEIIWVLQWSYSSPEGYGVRAFDYDNLNSSQYYTLNVDISPVLNDIKIDSSGTKLFYMVFMAGVAQFWLWKLLPFEGTKEVLYKFEIGVVESLRSLAVDRFMNKYIATNDGLYIVNEEGIIFEESIARNRNLKFDSTLVGNTSQKELTIFNPYSSALMIDSINFISPVFHSSGFAPINLSPMDSTTITITFEPNSELQYLEGINFYDNYAVHTINLIGKGFIIVDVSDIDNKTLQFYLSQNYPNPFNPVTTIKYQIPERSFVTVKVYDVLGNEIAALVSEEKPADSYEVEWNASDLPSGIYFYRMKAGNFVESKKMILLK